MSVQSCAVRDAAPVSLIPTLLPRGEGLTCPSPLGEASRVRVKLFDEGGAAQRRLEACPELVEGNERRLLCLSEEFHEGH
jgi:hypothetical protein